MFYEKYRFFLQKNHLCLTWSSELDGDDRQRRHPKQLHGYQSLFQYLISPSHSTAGFWTFFVIITLLIFHVKTRKLGHLTKKTLFFKTTLANVAPNENNLNYSVYNKKSDDSNALIASVNHMWALMKQDFLLLLPPLLCSIDDNVPIFSLLLASALLKSNPAEQY